MEGNPKELLTPAAPFFATSPEQITLRHYFAGLAMHALLSAKVFVDNERDLSKLSYAIADRMCDQKQKE